LAPSGRFGYAALSGSESGFLMASDSLHANALATWQRQRRAAFREPAGFNFIKIIESEPQNRYIKNA
jgi:hypothetical protein